MVSSRSGRYGMKGVLKQKSTLLWLHPGKPSPSTKTGQGVAFACEHSYEDIWSAPPSVGTQVILQSYVLLSPYVTGDVFAGNKSTASALLCISDGPDRSQTGSLISHGSQTSTQMRLHETG